MFDHLEKEADATRDDALVLASLHHGNRLPLLILAILVPFHRERLSGACLAVRKNSRIVTLRKRCKVVNCIGDKVKKRTKIEEMKKEK